MTSNTGNTSASSADPRSDSAGLRRSGAAGLALGLVALVVGIVILAWPSATLRVVAFLFALQLITFGVVRLWLAQGLPRDPRWLRAVTYVLAVLTVAAGLICLVSPGTSIATIALILAVGWLSDGISSVAHAFTATSLSGPLRLGVALGGIVLVGAALLVALFPQTSIALLIRYSGILLVVIGIAEIIGALLTRRRESRTATA